VESALERRQVHAPKIRLERAGARAKVSIADTGKGINPDFLPFVFDRFRQADGTTTRMHDGLGLGLAIVRHLVEAHGGTVWAESPGEGQGATFTITLPLPAGRLKPTAPVPFNHSAAQQPVRAAISQLHGVRVLVVDDDEDARQMLSTVLSLSGAEVRGSASASEALEELHRWQPDVLLSDIGMPHEDGYDLIQRVRALAAAQGGHVPAAALTAYARDEDRERALAAGFQLHVAKPIGSVELISAVAHLAQHAP
jgi:CheY-like chemotaxis protein